VLAHAAAVLRAGVRTGDLVGRYGGEEFCVLLRDTQAEGALVVAERFRAALAASPVSLPRGSVRVGASLGLAAFDPGSGEGFEALFRRADDALYRAKGAGRGRCEVAPATVDELAPRLSASPSPPG
jgi:diguanylate cyclase (GGDEF)-like protein